MRVKSIKTKGCRYSFSFILIFFFYFENAVVLFNIVLIRHSSIVHSLKRKYLSRLRYGLSSPVNILILRLMDAFHKLSVLVNFYAAPSIDHADFVC